GSFASYTSGWITWLSAAGTVGIEVLAAVQYASSYLPWLMESKEGVLVLTVPGIFVSIAMVAVFCVINMFGVKFFAQFNNVLVWWKLLVIVLVFVGLALLAFNPGHFHMAEFGGFAPNRLAPIFAALPAAGIVFSYLGFRQGVEFAGETKDPQKNMPFAVIGSIVLTGIIYILLQVAFIGAVPTELLQDGWGGLSFSNSAGPWAEIAIMLGAMWLAIILCAAESARPSTSPRRPKPTGPSKAGECGAGSSSFPDRDTALRILRTREGGAPVGLSLCLFGRHHHDRSLRAVEDFAADGTEQCRPDRAATARAEHRQLRRAGHRLKNITRVAEFDLDRDVEGGMALTQPVDRLLQRSREIAPTKLCGRVVDFEVRVPVPPFPQERHRREHLQRCLETLRVLRGQQQDRAAAFGEIDSRDHRCGGPHGGGGFRILPASRSALLGDDDGGALRMGRQGRGHRTEQLTEETAAAAGADGKRLRPGAESGEHSGRAAFGR
ncbi:MAG: APC family permease, partial [Brevibacterium sp.]|nr:APC family permease [Brevibacterium sp.]